MTFQPEPGPAFHSTPSSEEGWPRPGPERVRVLLCEDHEIYRIGLRVLIEREPDLVVVGEVVDIASACSLADRVHPHVVVIRQGLLQDVQEQSVGALCRLDRAVLILAETESEFDLAEALRAGARGYLSRRVAAPRLVDGIRALSRDGLALDPTFARHLVQFLTAGPTGPAETPTQLGALTRLTDRQRAVALLVAEGMSNGDIAAQLFVSNATVKSHLTTVLRRLGVRSRTQLAILVNNTARLD
ncbi:LuxR C-terminal-related transcriptional regulator [Micromonospora sp. DT81.3]|uniref:LuxR C-terminal-related transcriptional regulator n=1 Tax=Micromonospora sp. DT81.3 TaxID=3416523 RepID=UPI003CF4C5E6